MSHCYCGSGAGYAQCCEPLHKGAAAASPEALMRSRYSAFVLKDSAYVLKSWHLSTRPKELDLTADDLTPAEQHWCGLTVLSSAQEQHKGTVHFEALFKEQAGFFRLQEHSNFLFEQGHWLYVDGDCEVIPLRPKRNDLCPCGSAKKFKKCCER